MLEMSRQALINREEHTAQEVLNLEREFCDPLCDAIERFVDSVILEGGIDSLERRRCSSSKALMWIWNVWRITPKTWPRLPDCIYHEVPFSNEATVDLGRLFDQAISRSDRDGRFRASDVELAKQALRLEDEMDHLALSVREGHLKRVRLGVCDPEEDVLFVETIRNLERISDHADNIAVSVLRKV